MNQPANQPANEPAIERGPPPSPELVPRPQASLLESTRAAPMWRVSFTSFYP